MMWGQRNDSPIATTTLEWIINRKGIVQETLTQNERLLRQLKGVAQKLTQSLFSVRRQLASVSVGEDLSAGQKAGRLKKLEEQERAIVQQLGVDKHSYDGPAG